MLDKQKTYSAYDPGLVGHAIERMGEQVRAAWRETSTMALPRTYRAARQVVVVGMGGSALGAEVAVHALKKLAVPVVYVRDYALPAHVTRESLIVLSSFSGTTEEVLAVADEVVRRKLKAVVMTTGGVLADIAERMHWPIYRFAKDEIAPDGRFAMGHSFAGLLGILHAAGIAPLSDNDVRRMHSAMCDVLDTSAIDVPTSDNPAKTVAHAVVSSSVLVLAAEHLVGNAHVLQNQLHETGRHAARFLALPEADHHALEGDVFPKGAARATTVVMLRSHLYDPRNAARCALTADLLEEKGMTVIDYTASGKDTLEECAEVLQFTSFVAYYLGLLHGVDPMTMPQVTEFKRRLAI